MAYSKTYRTTVPLPPDTDLEVARWLIRESFERKATSDSLRINDYQEESVAPEDIPPKVAEDLGKPVSDFVWFTFTATATVLPELINA